MCLCARNAWREPLLNPPPSPSVSDQILIHLYPFLPKVHTFPKHTMCMSKSEARNLLEIKKKPSILLDEAKISFQVAKCIKLFNSNTALPVGCKAASSVATTYLHHVAELVAGPSSQWSLYQLQGECR